MKITRKTLRSVVLGGLVAVAAAAPAFALDGLDFRLHNNTDRVITSFYINPVGTSQLIALSGPTIGPGRTSTVSFHGSYESCYYNLLAKFSDGTTEVDRDVNLCRTSDIYA